MNSVNENNIIQTSEYYKRYLYHYKKCKQYISYQTYLLKHGYVPLLINNNNILLKINNEEVDIVRQYNNDVLNNTVSLDTYITIESERRLIFYTYEKVYDIEYMDWLNKAAILIISKRNESEQSERGECDEDHRV